MSNLKIDDYENTSDTYTFPYNPNSIEFVTSKNLEQRPIPYGFTFLGFASSMKSSIGITLNGHFSGTNKNSNYRSLVKKVNSPILLRLFFENTNDKFYLCIGSTVQKVPTGTRPLHVDYVAAFFSPFGILFDATQKSGTSGSSEENEGDLITPIEKITGSVSSGTPVTIEDGDGNGFTFTPNASGTMTYYLVKVISTDNEIYTAEYAYVVVGTTPQIITNASSTGDIFLRIAPGDSISDTFSGGTISGITPTFYFRDGWSSD